jgi:tRNA pseudouridine32 synthase/23S rRNA pseudouridine746 synthase
MGGWLRDHVDARVDVTGLLAAGRFVYADAAPVLAADAYRPHTFVWFHRDLREEPVVPGELTVVHRDERLVVRLRDELGLPELTPMHRLDRVTSGLVLCATERRWRAAYQAMFADGTVTKTYRALAPWRADLTTPRTVRDHVAPVPRTGRARVVPGAPVNAETRVELEERRGDLAVYRLSPTTGRTHQLRLHLLGLGAPIVDDPLYPVDLEVDVDDFSRPLQLLAAELDFVDPVDGAVRRFASPRRLPLRPV